MAGVPAGETGLYRKRIFPDGSIEYSVDYPTLKIILEHGKQAAIESGQWQNDAATPGDKNCGRIVIGRIRCSRHQSSSRSHFEVN
jgi:hypothetical protein